MKINRRPWGTWEILAAGPGYQVKRLTVKPRARLSLQFHHYRSETWTVAAGSAWTQVGDIICVLGSGTTVFVPAGTGHRLGNPLKKPLVVIEVQRGAYIHEDDIVRVQDDYGRTP